MSGKPLRLKDLIPVTFTLAKDGDKRALIAKDVCCFVATHFDPLVCISSDPSMNSFNILSVFHQQNLFNCLTYLCSIVGNVKLVHWPIVGWLLHLLQ